MTIKRTSLALMTGFLAGCVPNQAFRTQGEVDCVSDFVGCKNALIEKYEKYDLAFIEFTDRGNLFSRTRYAHVLERIKKAADADPGAAVIVFVHGWKHNASFDDANVKSFRQMLKILSDNGLTFGRRPIGIYVGWRGLSVDMAGVKELTYWERKAVAQEVGKGGVTEVLLRLRQVTAANRNLYVVVGHSFGGAIVLSALSEVLIDQMISAPECVSDTCLEAIGFGHGVILLNPAIEATEGFQLKEASTSLDFPSSMKKLMHVISTDGDTATHKLFPWGQKLNLFTWSRTNLQRQSGGKDLVLAESSMDTTTIGNFKAFRTARLEQTPGQHKEWKISLCDKGDQCGLNDAEWEQHFDAAQNDPLSFVSTDASFIRDHNDIFNCNVTAYLAAVVESTRVRRKQSPLNGCSANGQFDLLECFKAYHAILKGLRIQNEYPNFCPIQKL